MLFIIFICLLIKQESFVSILNLFEGSFNVIIGKP